MLLKVLVLLLFTVVLVNAEEESCYTVQLVSATNSDTNYEKFSYLEDDDSVCKLMEIANKLTIRCGCYTTKKEAHEHLVSFQSSYKDAYIRKTYKYRFDNFEESIVEKETFLEKTPQYIEKKRHYHNVSNSEIDTLYAQGIQYYKQKQFQKSYKIFSKLYLQRLLDKDLNFYLGKSAFETGHYKMALGAFERVEILDTNNPKNKLELAKTYYMLKMYTDSQIAFADVLKNKNLSPKLRKSLNYYLSSVKKVQQKSFTYAKVNLEWIYDSNVNYSSLNGDFVSNTGIVGKSAKASDIALQVYGSVTNLYDIGQKDSFVLKNRVVGLLKSFKTQKNYDTKYIAYMPSLYYTQVKHLVAFGLGVDTLNVGSQNFLNTIWAEVAYGYQHNANLRSDISLKYKKKYFQNSLDYDLNANHYELNYTLNKILSPRSYIYGKLQGIQETKNHGNRPDVNYDALMANIFYTTAITSVYGVDLYSEVRQREYLDNNIIFNTRRKDKEYMLEIALKAQLLDSLKVKLKGSYNQVNSNQDIYSYKKNTISLGLYKVF